jgi:hypothetical protein
VSKLLLFSFAGGYQVSWVRPILLAIGGNENNAVAHIVSLE